MPPNQSYGRGCSSRSASMALGMIRPIALSHFVQEFLSLMIFHRCHSALYGCLVHDFLPEVSHGSLARVQVPARHSRCGASKALRARGSPSANSILLDLDSSQMVQGIPEGAECGQQGGQEDVNPSIRFALDHP